VVIRRLIAPHIDFGPLRRELGLPTQFSPAAQLQADPLMKGIPIIFLTAAVKKEELSARDGFIGGFPYIAKPLDAKGVQAQIEKQLAA